MHILTYTYMQIDAYIYININKYIDKYTNIHTYIPQGYTIIDYDMIGRSPQVSNVNINHHKDWMITETLNIYLNLALQHFPDRHEVAEGNNI